MAAPPKADPPETPPETAAETAESPGPDPRATEADLNTFLQPGMFVRHPAMADWGLGQVQSSINGRITVMFEEAGKVVIDGRKIALLPVFDA